MRTLTLTRDAMSGGATTGTLSENGVEVCKTLEREYIDNASNVSCIPVSPEGGYLCKPVNSPRFGLTYEVTGVEGRSHILFHSGNTEKDTHGCILVGLTSNGRAGNRAMLYSSRAGHEKFMAHLHGADEFRLLIREEHPMAC